MYITPKTSFPIYYLKIEAVKKKDYFNKVVEISSMSKPQVKVSFYRNGNVHFETKVLMLIPKDMLDRNLYL